MLEKGEEEREGENVGERNLKKGERRNKGEGEKEKEGIKE